MNTSNLSAKDIGNLGEKIAAYYLVRHGFRVIDHNVSRKTGELDIIAVSQRTMHIVEVKTRACQQFPSINASLDWSPADDLHVHKIRKVARTAKWYVAEKRWDGEWQIDGILVWIRKGDGRALIQYLPHIS